jgi:hypothetical protein
MSLRDRVLEAAGSARWATLRRFTSHLMLHGSLVAPLEAAHSLKEIVAEGDLVSRSIRISGFSDAGGAWGFYPDFVTIQQDDGAFLGARREAAPRPFRDPKDEAELVYLCGLSIWSCMTAPLDLVEQDARAEELGAWSERGQTWHRLRVSAPQGALACSREAVMYFGEDSLLRRTDFEVVCGDTIPLVAYSSAHQSFSGLTVPTLHRIVRRGPLGVLQKRPVLDVEIFDAAFD